MLWCRPLGHVDACFGKDGLNGDGIEAMDLGEINAAEAKEASSQIEVGVVTLVLFSFG